MKKYIFFVGFFSVVIIFFVFSSAKREVYKKKLIVDLKIKNKEINRLTHHNQMLEKQIIKQLKLEGETINNFIFEDDEDKKKSLYIDSLISEGPVLLFRFYEQNCSKCILEHLDNLNKFLQTDNISYVVISNYSYARPLKFFMQENGIYNPIFRCDSLIPNEMLDPFFCIIDNKKKIQNVFFPSDDNSQLTESYFKDISKKY